MDRAAGTVYRAAMVQVDLSKWSLCPEVLSELIILAPHPRTRERLMAIWKIAQGESSAHLSGEIQRDPHTVLKWVHDFNRSGPEGLVYRRTGGRPTQNVRGSSLIGEVLQEAVKEAGRSVVQKKHQRCC